MRGGGGGVAKAVKPGEKKLEIPLKQPRIVDVTQSSDSDMAKNNRNLRKALDRFQGKDYKLERQRKQEKEAAKRRERKTVPKLHSADDENSGEAVEEQGPEDIKEVLAALARHRGTVLAEDEDLDLDQDDVDSRSPVCSHALDHIPA